MNNRNDYTGASREFLRKAFDELAQGDVVQASEKGWGAAAQMVKAVAEQRGWPHNGHALLYEAVRALVQETGDSQLANLFHVAGNLHVNFYENWIPADLVELGLQDVQVLLDKLEPLLG
jgi:hypothetical protein